MSACKTCGEEDCDQKNDANARFLDDRRADIRSTFDMKKSQTKLKII